MEVNQGNLLGDRMKKPNERLVTVRIELALDEAMERKAKREGKVKYAVYNDAIRAYIGKNDAAR